MNPKATKELKDKVVDLLLTYFFPANIDAIESVLRMASAEIRFAYENGLIPFRDEKSAGSGSKR